MSSNENSVVKAGLWYTITNFLTRGMSFLITPIFTRIMSASDIGAYSNLSAWLQVLLPIVSMEFYSSLTLARFDYRDELNQYSSTVLVFGSVITLLFYGVVIVNIKLFMDLFSMNAFSIHILFLYILFYPAMLMFQSRNMFEYKYRTTTVVSISSLFVSVVLALMLTLNAGEGGKLKARIMGYYVPQIIFSLALYIYILNSGRCISRKYIKYAVSLSFPVVWHSLAMHLLGTGDRLVITRVLGTSANAMYSVAFTTGVIAQVLWNAMNNAWSPWSHVRMNRGETERMKKASRGYILLYGFFVIVLLLITPELLYIMGGKTYIEAVNVLPPVIVSCMCQFVYSLYVNAEFYLKKQTRVAIATLVAAALNIGLNLVFVPKYGYVAAAYTTLAGYLFLLVFHYGSIVLLGKKGWYDDRFNFMVVGMFLVLVPMINWLYGHNTVRYICILAVGIAVAVLALIYRKTIEVFIKKYLGGQRKLVAE